MRAIVFGILVFVMLAAAVPAYPMSGGGESVRIEVVREDGGAFLSIPFKEEWKSGTRIIRKYLEAGKGENYAIEIRNMTPERVGVVIAVDGRNIISGKRSDLKHVESMYIVDGYGYARYDGWRTDGDTVHKFYFTDITDSYSVITFADSSAMGVIAVAVYREKEQYRHMFGVPQQEASQPPSPAVLPQKKSKSSGNESAGTGFGDRQYSPSYKVEFEAEGFPVQKTLLKYEWHDVLCKKGILRCGHKDRTRLWDEDEFAPYPPGYRGR